METGGRVGDGLLDLCRDPLGGGVSDRNLAGRFLLRLGREGGDVRRLGISVLEDGKNS